MSDRIPAESDGVEPMRDVEALLEGLDPLDDLTITRIYKSTVYALENRARSLGVALPHVPLPDALTDRSPSSSRPRSSTPD